MYDASSQYLLYPHSNNLQQSVSRMDILLLSRELGDERAAANLRLGYTTKLMHSIQSTSNITFSEKHPMGVNALDIERQNSKLYVLKGVNVSG